MYLLSWPTGFHHCLIKSAFLISQVIFVCYWVLPMSFSDCKTSYLWHAPKKPSQEDHDAEAASFPRWGKSVVIGNDTYPQLNTFSSFKIIVVLIFNSFMSNFEILSILYSELTLIAIVLILSQNVSYHWTKVISVLFILITAFFKNKVLWSEFLLSWGYSLVILTTVKTVHLVYIVFDQ